MKYIQPFGIVDENAPYINGNPETGVQGSIPPAAAFENPMREIHNAIEKSLFTPSNTDLFQLGKSMRSQRLNYAVDTGSADHLLVAYNPAIDAYTDGLVLRVKVAHDNTGPTDINAGPGTVAVKRANGSALDAGDIKANQVVELTFDGSFFQITNFFGLSAGTTNNNNFTQEIPYALDSSVTPNVIVANFNPAITSLVDGLFVTVKVANAVTGATTLKANGTATTIVTLADDTDLKEGMLPAGAIGIFIYNSDHWQFMGLLPSTALDGRLGKPGDVILVLGNAAPAGAVKMNGALLNRSGTYAGLWAYAQSSGRLVAEAAWQDSAQRLWTSFSDGDGATTFRVPDVRAEFLRFWDDGRNADPSRVLGFAQTDQVKNHTHPGTVGSITPNFVNSQTGQGNYPFQDGSGSSGLDFLLPTGGGVEHNNMASSIDDVVPLPIFGKVSSLSMTIANPTGGGVENRPRNASLLACVVY